MVDVGNLAALALLGAVGLVSYQYFQFDKRYKADQEKQKFENARVLQAINEGKGLVEQLRAETARLQKVKASAEETGDRLNAIISEAEAEAENGERIVSDLKMVAQAGERTCTRITDLVSAAAELHRAVKQPLEEMHKSPAKPPRKNSVIRDRVSAAPLPPLKVAGGGDTNIVQFPVVK